jgi:tetratricopeptide (TPR) repeat protein
MISLRLVLLSFCIAVTISSAAAAGKDFRIPYREGVELNKKGDLIKAIAAYSKAIEIKPDEAGIYYVRGRAYRQMDQLDKAVADFTKAITLKPDYAEAYNERGRTYIGKGDMEKCRADFKLGCELKNENACANMKKFK